MRFRRALTLLAGLLVLGASACTQVPVSHDPIVQSDAGYVLYPDQGSSYENIYLAMGLPTFTCLPKQNSTVRWFAALDGLPGAANQAVSARAGLILGCKNGSPSYLPFYGLYKPGQSSPDHRFVPVHLVAGDMVIVSIGAMPHGDFVEFQMGLSKQPGQPVRPAWNQDVRLKTTQISGSAAGCLLEAPIGSYALPKATSFESYGCLARTEWTSSGMFWAPNLGNQKTRSLNMTTKAGKHLTSLHGDGGDKYHYGYILER
jgi:hypothetical protein